MIDRTDDATSTIYNSVFSGEGSFPSHPGVFAQGACGHVLLFPQNPFALAATYSRRARSQDGSIVHTQAGAADLWASG